MPKNVKKNFQSDMLDLIVSSTQGEDDEKEEVLQATEESSAMKGTPRDVEDGRNFGHAGNRWDHSVQGQWKYPYMPNLQQNHN